MEWVRQWLVDDIPSIIIMEHVWNHQPDVCFSNIFPVRQLGLLFPTEWKVMTHVPNHQPVVTWVSANSPFWPISLLGFPRVDRAPLASQQGHNEGRVGLNGQHRQMQQREVLRLTSAHTAKDWWCWAALIGENGCVYGDIIYYSDDLPVTFWEVVWKWGPLQFHVCSILYFFHYINSRGGRVCHFKHAQMSPWNLQKTTVIIKVTIQSVDPKLWLLLLCGWLRLKIIEGAGAENLGDFSVLSSPFCAYYCGGAAHAKWDDFRNQMGILKLHE